MGRQVGGQSRRLKQMDERIGEVGATGWPTLLQWRAIQRGPAQALLTGAAATEAVGEANRSHNNSLTAVDVFRRNIEEVVVVHLVQ